MFILEIELNPKVILIVVGALVSMGVTYLAYSQNQLKMKLLAKEKEEERQLEMEGFYKENLEKMRQELAEAQALSEESETAAWLEKNKQLFKDVSKRSFKKEKFGEEAFELRKAYLAEFRKGISKHRV